MLLRIINSASPRLLYCNSRFSDIIICELYPFLDGPARADTPATATFAAATTSYEQWEICVSGYGRVSHDTETNNGQP